MSAGTEVLALNCGRELRQLGHEVAFFASTATVTVGDPSSVTAQTYDQFTVFHLRHGSSALVNATSVSAADSSVLEGFRQAVQTFAPDIVHFMHFMRLTMSPLEVCTELNIPAVVTPTDFWLLCPTAQLRDPVAGNFCGGPTTQATNCIRHFAVESLPAPLHRAAAATPLAIYTLAVALLPWMPQRFSQRAERAVELVDRIQQVRAHLTKVRYFFSPTEHIQRMLIGLGVQQERIGLVPYGVPTPALQMQQKCAPRSAAAKALRIGFIGTFAEHKGAHVLLAALQQLPDADQIGRAHV